MHRAPSALSGDEPLVPIGVGQRPTQLRIGPVGGVPGRHCHQPGNPLGKQRSDHIAGSGAPVVPDQQDLIEVEGLQEAAQVMPERTDLPAAHFGIRAETGRSEAPEKRPVHSISAVMPRGQQSIPTMRIVRPAVHGDQGRPVRGPAHLVADVQVHGPDELGHIDHPCAGAALRWPQQTSPASADQWLPGAGPVEHLQGRSDVDGSSRKRDDAVLVWRRAHANRATCRTPVRFLPEVIRARAAHAQGSRRARGTIETKTIRGSPPGSGR